MNNLRLSFFVFLVMIVGCSKNIQIRDHNKFVSTDQYEQYHIPMAMLYHEQELLSAMELSDLIILYGENNERFIPEILENYKKVYILDVGIEE